MHPKYIIANYFNIVYCIVYIRISLIGIEKFPCAKDILWLKLRLMISITCIVLCILRIIFIDIKIFICIKDTQRTMVYNYLIWFSNSLTPPLYFHVIKPEFVFNDKEYQKICLCSVCLIFRIGDKLGFVNFRLTGFSIKVFTAPRSVTFSHPGTFLISLFHLNNPIHTVNKHHL